jgi:deoxyribose-phosphate aldolase
MSTPPATLRLTPSDVARFIDHSLLGPALPPREVEEGCRLAAKLHTASVCVKPCDVARAAAVLRGTGVEVGTVIGFPHGGATPGVKLAEAVAAMDDGAVELDLVINVGALKGGDDGVVEGEVAGVVAAAHARGALGKVILENAYLSRAEKLRAYACVLRARADFLKTSTGFAPSGSTLPDLRLMRDAVAAAGAGGWARVKAAGGIRTLDALLAAVAAGVTRVGATASAAIVAEAVERAAASGGVLEVALEPVGPPPTEEEEEAEKAGGAPAASTY